MAPLDLLDYLAEFDLTLADLRPEQAAMFLAGRNAAQYVVGLETPVGPSPRDLRDATLAERETEQSLSLTAYSDDPLESRLPTDEMDVSRLHSIEDLPRIFPVQWLLEEVNPELFQARLAQGELLMPEWQRPTERPRDAWDDAPRRELVREDAAARALRLHAYVLLDTSRTMQDHDRRGTIARGLALEFLRKGHAERARLTVRPFTDDVGDLLSGTSRDEFLQIVRQVVELPNRGQTRIQTALERAVRDIRSEGPCLGASILLVTDGISRLTHNPLGEEKLHTFLLGDLFEETAGAGTVTTLKSWSQSFRRVWKSHFPEFLVPAWSDCESAMRFVQLLQADRGEDASGTRGGRIHRAVKNVRFLVDEFKRSLGKRAAIPAEVRALEEQLERAAASAPKIEDLALDALRGALGTGRSGPQAASGGAALGSGESAGFWAMLRAFAARVWGWCRRFLGGFLRRRRQRSEVP